MSDGVTAAAFLGTNSGLPPDPFLLPDMDRAVARIRQALQAGESIAVYGDFDVDGVTATAILTEGLGALGARVRPFIPNRFRHGYGINGQALSRLAGEGVSLIITVDCGISAIEEIAEAGRLGMSAIVVDHHEVGEVMPAAAAIVDPKRPNSQYPTYDLCSGALALRLIQALYSALGRALDPDDYVDLAALATVCDMVPLRGENRDLVKAGLPAMAKTRRPGLRALLAMGGSPDDLPDADTLGYRIGPRLNAAGRLEDASLALEVLTTRDPERAGQLVQKLNELNLRRQGMVDAALLLAGRLAEQEPAGSAAIVVGHESISRGIVGLIASRLVETYGRPAFVYEVGPDGCVGSARGVPGFNVLGALGQTRHLLTRHGGHQAAGGFALPTANLEDFRSEIVRASAQQSGAGCPAPTLDIDADAPLSALAGPTLSYITAFAPCGAGNPAPVIMSPAVSVVRRRAIGSGKHLLVDLRAGRVNWRAFAFGRGADAETLGTELDIVYSVENGSRGYGPRLRLHDWHDSTMMRVGR